MIVARDHIGIFGKMNAGKSSVMNLLTGQDTSIVDSTAGTTTDTLTTLKEIDGLGPVKMYDTAGADESKILGEKKRKKVFLDLKKCDLVLLVINPSTNDFSTEKKIIEKAHKQNKQLLVIFNIFKESGKKNIQKIKSEISLIRLFRDTIIEANDNSYRQQLLNFIIDNFESKNQKVELLPFLKKNEFYILNMIMGEDEITDKSPKLLAMLEEYITRNWAYLISFRSSLKEVKNDILNIMSNLKKKPKAIITNPEAIKFLNDIVPKDIVLTSISLALINHISKGNPSEFVKGLNHIDTLKKGEKIMIVEATKHSKIGKEKRKINIPNSFTQKYLGVIVEHNYWDEFQKNENVNDYKLIIHQGGHMVSSKKILTKLRGLDIPYTDQGLFLVYNQGIDKIKRILKPWKLDNLIK